MSEPIPFKEANKTLTPPKGDKECCDLPVFCSDEYVISKWKFTTAEIDEIRETGCVWLWVHTRAGTHPPVSVSGKYPFVNEEAKPLDSEG